MTKKSKTIENCIDGGIKNSPYVSETGVYKKVKCEDCGCLFVQDDNEPTCAKCLYCKQDPMEEIDFINQKKERMKMKKNGI